MSFAIAAVLFACLPQSTSQTGWQSIPVPDGPGSLAPRLSVAGDAAIMSWLEPVAGAQVEGKTYALRAARLGRDGLVPFAAPAVQNDQLFVNWADTPGVVLNSDGSLLAHWLEKSGGETYAYNVQLARSVDGGLSWTSLGRLHSDDQAVEHGFANFAQGSSGLTAVWLDGRETGGGENHGGGHGGGGGAMTLRTAHVSDGVRQELLLDGDVCDCCPTAIVSTANGPVVAYRDRVVGDEVRDIAIVRWLGDRWSDPAVVHGDGWFMPGCPVNGPALAAHGERVALAWYTGASEPTLRICQSSDGGATFDEPQVLLVDRPGVRTLGRPSMALDKSGALHVVHLAKIGDDEGVFWQTRRRNGEWSEAQLVAQVTTGRRAGVPVLARAGDQLLLATTSVDDEGGTRVELRRLAPSE